MQKYGIDYSMNDIDDEGNLVERKGWYLTQEQLNQLSRLKKIL